MEGLTSKKRFQFIELNNEISTEAAKKSLEIFEWATLNKVVAKKYMKYSLKSKWQRFIY